MKRNVEIFVAGCPACDETVKLVQAAACPSCDVTIHDLRTDTAAQSKANQYGIKRVPTVVVDGKVADCCQQTQISKDVLRSMGVGVAL